MVEQQEGAPAGAVKYIVAVQAGSAAETPLRVTLPESLLASNVQQTIDYVLGQNHSKRGERMAEAIRAEMNGEYGITANGTAVPKEAPVLEHFSERTAENVKYFGIDLIVGSKQTGGIERLF